MSQERFFLMIGGQAVPGETEIEVINPATEAVLALAPAASPHQLDEAVTAAMRAYPAWRATPLTARRNILRALGDLLRTHADELAALLTREQGKPLAAARVEIMVAAAWCDGIARLDLPVAITEDNAERRSETRRVPLGVVAAIVPWNFPVGLAFWKVAPALMAGNTVVVKPSPFTPLTTLRIGELGARLLPPGVLNVISGEDELGPLLTSHAGVAKISFTGSTTTGREVMRSASAGLKRITLELGGNDPAIVLRDVDIAAAARSLFWAAFRNSGQFCVAAKRIYVHEDIYERFAAALIAYSRTVRMGVGSEPGVELGPIQNRRQYERVTELIARARAAGLKFLTGEGPARRPGYFVAATIIDDPPDDAEVVTAEAFGPVVPLLRFADIEDVVRRANDSPFGLAASVWSADAQAAMHIGERLDCGTVWINDVHYMTPLAPFGGHKQSGLGVENGYDGLLEYTAAQTMVVRKQPMRV